MKVRFERQFAKDLKDIRDVKLRGRIREAIEEVKNAADLSEVKQVTKMSGYSNFYRIRPGDYRIGIELAGDEVIFVRALHRRDIYRYFP
ncbi:MAG: type II toxin-antitoxin system RelE/ParE family toxin [Caldilineales bacterium]|nr:type II toxin-antitoxin system RelE/ParE family toxin [Caldilineales bacterium]